MKKLLYVRHGETEMNASSLWAGHIETPLTKNGKQQARNAGVTLRNNKLHIDLIISSPLSRAYETAKYIAKEIGYPVSQIKKNDLFIERGFGKAEGTAWDEFHKTKRLEDMDSVDGAETVAQLHERAIKALEYVKASPEDTILIVSHGSFGRAFRRVVNNEPHHYEYIDEHRERYRIGNAEIVEIF